MTEFKSKFPHALRKEIEAETARHAELQELQAQSRSRLRALKAELAALATDGGVVPANSIEVVTHTPAASNETPTSDAGKVKLFRERFRGREDVYAKLWSNPRSGKKGYSPACSNEWVRGVCEKPKVRCGECSHQAFLPLDDLAIRSHLQGRHVVGVYPLRKDDTCWFLAVDFDKTSWEEDVTAFVRTCRDRELHPAVERSRSGNGAHVWFFFAEPVAASLARKMGCFLITETMASHYKLGMNSYDRLFPNQDTMPRGGFGNLIALPLQREARAGGNTLFVDEDLGPFPDQWGFLASVTRIVGKTVEMIADEATRKGQIIGVRMPTTGDDGEEQQPWNIRPSRTRAEPVIQEALPESVRAVLSQRVFVEKIGLPSALLNRIKRLAAFQNPEFYKKQSMRLSTSRTPRVIACAEEFPHHIAIPRGCLSDLEDLLQSHAARISVNDERIDRESVAFLFQGQLTPPQLQAARVLLQHDVGVFVAPPGAGKTVVGAWLVGQRKCSTLILVHRGPLLDQWRTRLSMFLGIDPKEVGQIGAGKRRLNGRLDVAMIQSLSHKNVVDDRVAEYGQVIVDECHHIPAVSFERIMAEVKARFVTGLTATPVRRDGHHPIIHMQCGPVRFVMDPHSDSVHPPFRQRLIVRETGLRIDDDPETLTIQQIYGLIGGDVNRNQLILSDVIDSLAKGRSPILLTERREHLDYFADRLRGAANHTIVLKGGMTAKQRQALLKQIAEIPPESSRVVLATGRYIGEGFDDSRLDTLFLAMPIAWKGTLIQYTGRLHRPYPDKEEVQIYDYLDRDLPVLSRMFEKRMKAYRAIGYETEPHVGRLFS